MLMLKQQLDMPPTSARVLLLVSASEPPVEVEAPTDACAPRVLEIVPDVEPARVLGLAEHFIHNPVNARQNVLELVILSLRI
jgi:TRIAD3 protein (E3 ubiquitin-protein ligase RNF216)